MRGRGVRAIPGCPRVVGIPGTLSSPRAELAFLCRGKPPVRTLFARNAARPKQLLQCGRQVCAPFPYAPLPRAHHVRVQLQRRFPAQVPGPAAVQADKRAATVVACELAICREAWR